MTPRRAAAHVSLFSALFFGLGSSRAAADPVTPVVVAPPSPAPARDVTGPLAGALTAFVPFTIGCALWAQDRNVAAQNAGTIVMASGFALAPWVAHGINRRWKRAAIYGALSVATSAATIGYMQYKDPFEPGYRNVDRVPFGMLLTSALFASAIGVIDSFVSGPAPRTDAP
jgi:hypothetical protein